jgi:hypothetical protein
MTSCNRIKQVLLSLSINYQVIKERFSVIIVDNSTPDKEVNSMCQEHDSEDPYNFVKPYNYCSDVNLLYEAHKFFPNIDRFEVVHHSPRMYKQRGEANLISLGLMQASLMGRPRISGERNYCLKITGASILVRDIVSELPSLLDGKDFITWHRTNIGGDQRSSRIFGCNPASASKIILDLGWDKFIDDVNFMEDRISHLASHFPQDRLLYTGLDETDVLLEGGMGLHQGNGRSEIEKFIQSKNIDTNATPYLKEFSDGGIW